MAQALKSLTGKWGIAIGAWFAFFILTNLETGWEWQGDDGGDYKASLGIISLIISGPLSLGYTTLILLISRNKKLDFVILFSGFKRFGASFAAHFYNSLDPFINYPWNYCMSAIFPNLLYFIRR